MIEQRGPEDHRPARPAPGLRGSTLIITNFTKLVGLGIAINEMVVRTDARQSVVGYCALTLLGTQVAESILLRIIDRIFAKERE